MLRSVLLRAASKAKMDGASDFLVRYNPLFRGRVQRTLSRFREESAAGADKLEQQLILRVLHAGQHTRYGAGRPDILSDWPVLEKAMLRAVPENFLNTRSLLSIPSSTAGTTGACC